MNSMGNRVGNERGSMETMSNRVGNSTMETMSNRVGNSTLETMGNWVAKNRSMSKDRCVSYMCSMTNNSSMSMANYMGGDTGGWGSSSHTKKGGDHKSLHFCSVVVSQLIPCTLPM